MFVRAFRRLFNRERIASAGRFETFIKRNAAFAAQHSIIGYCRVKAGLNHEKLFREADFKAALEVSRWEGFAAVAADLLAIAEARMRGFLPGREAELANALAAVYAKLLAEERPQPSHRPDGWEDLTGPFTERLARLQIAAPKPAHEIARMAAKRVWDTCPIHPDTRKGDMETVTGSILFQITAVAVKMEESCDLSAVAHDLVDRAARAAEVGQAVEAVGIGQ